MFFVLSANELRGSQKPKLLLTVQNTDQAAESIEQNGSVTFSLAERVLDKKTRRPHARDPIALHAQSIMMPMHDMMT